ncbi:MAG: hypothetical protein IJU03_12975 [Thermoguttaceae bacterium]|nr:hypothetical protein [Thermoguttaceae bacterium]
MKTLMKLALSAVCLAIASLTPCSTQALRAAEPDDDSGALCAIEKERWSLTIATTENGAKFQSGRFGELMVLPTEIFRLRVADKSGAISEFTSESEWRSVRLQRADDLVELWFVDPTPCEKIAVMIAGRLDDDGVSWRVEIANDSQEYSVIDATYPIPAVAGDPLNLFAPDRSGRAIMNVGKKGYKSTYSYPNHVASMQYFAYWGEKNGIYLGFHDPDGAMKNFAIDVANGEARLRATFPAIGAGNVANSFSLGGEMRWQTFDGDWYDATMLYKSFVVNKAKWTPVKGRPDTPQQFKEIPYWICDYIPNSEKQLDARPMTLATVSERYGKDYWVDAPIKLKERLGTPVGYQVYNWHEIPFNINYPHFLPAREEFRVGLDKLKAAGLYVFPYINAVSWEMDDADEGFEENFANVGVKGAALNSDGAPIFYPYPQVKASGEKTRLAIMCPGFARWREIVEEVARGLEANLPIDGIYFDQIAAVAPAPCRNPNHGHLTGGGSYWSDGYCGMMAKIRAGKPENAFYYSESNAEVYVGAFDGLLTWIWTKGDDVPAFPAIYAGRVQMLGRYTDGATRDDDDYFRYHIAEGLLFGQQLGWLNANVVFNDDRMAFLEKIVRTRYEQSKLFNEGTLMRPPKVECNLEPVTSSGITMRQVVAGAWKMDDGSKTVLFVVNVSKQPAQATLRFSPEEYGVDCADELRLELPPTSVQVIEL